MSVSAELFAIIAPVFVCAAIGFAWTKSGRPYDTAFVTTLATNIGAPSLVFATLTGSSFGIGAFTDMMIAALIAIGAMLAIGAAILASLRFSQGAYLPALVFSNSGNMGLPLCLFAFGEPGLAAGIAYFSMGALGNFTVGVALASGTFSPWRLIRAPIIWSVIISLVVVATEFETPLWAGRTIKLIGDLTIPLMLMTLGASLARLKLRSLPRSALLAVVRLGMGFGVGVAVAWLLGLGHVEGGVLIIQCTMPVAVFNYLFAQRYGREPEEVAGMVLISTAISFLTLPALLLYVL